VEDGEAEDGLFWCEVFQKVCKENGRGLSGSRRIRRDLHQFDFVGNEPEG
jgi:hypothetical protein